MLTKFTKTWKYMTGCLACVLVIPYCRSWSWCDPIFRASLLVGKKHDGETRQLLSLIDRITGWETLGAFNRSVTRTDIEVVSVFAGVEADGDLRDEQGLETFPVAHADSKLRDGGGGNGFHGHQNGKRPSN